MFNRHGARFYPVCSNPQYKVSPFTERVLSAKLLKTKQLQNQLFETQTQLNEIMNKNKSKSLHKRQDYALKKYEGNQKQLPQLIKWRNEEMRILSANYKQLKSNYQKKLVNALFIKSKNNLFEAAKYLVAVCGP